MHHLRLELSLLVSEAYCVARSRLAGPQHNAASLKGGACPCQVLALTQLVLFYKVSFLCKFYIDTQFLKEFILRFFFLSFFISWRILFSLEMSCPISVVPHSALEGSPLGSFC